MFKLVFIISLFVSLTCKAKDELAVHGLTVSTQGPWTLLDQNERSGKELSFFKVTYINKTGERLEFDVTWPLEKTKALHLAKTQTAVITNTYETQVTPYAGEQTNSETCQEIYKPKKFSVKNELLISDVIAARTNDRFIWGNCRNDKKAQLGFFSYVYLAEEKKLIRLIFFQKENPKTINQSLKFFENLKLKEP